MKRRTAPAAPPLMLCLLGVLSLVSCAREEPPPPVQAPAAASDEPGADTLVIAALADAESFISVVHQSNWDGEVIDNMAQKLNGDEFDCRPLFPPGLAKSFEVAPDALSITYRLRTDQKWSDGVPITARDVAYTYELIADPKVASPRISYIEHMKPEARPRVVDDHTVVFEFTHAYDRYSQIAHSSTINILPEHVLSRYDRASLRGTDFDKAPVVSGPWKLGKHDKNSLIELLPNENYTGDHKATLARVIVKVIPEYATRLIELEKGTVDMIEGGFQNADDLARIKKLHPEYKMYRRGWRFLDYIGWNLKDPLFAEREVRRALTMAIDRQKLVRDLLTTEDGEELGQEAVSWVTPELCDYRMEGLKALPYDPEQAKQVLAAHGWKDSNGDGILDKGGKPFRFVLMTNSGNIRRAKAMVIVQANLKAIGLDVQLETVEGNTSFERLRKKSYQAALSGWSAGLFVDPIELWHSDTPDHTYEFNFTSYSNPKADELMERGMRTPDPAEAAVIWRELQQVVYEDQPYTFLYWRNEIMPLHERFRDADVDVLSMIHNLNRWWVPKDKVKYKR